ncbi:MAG: ATP-binding protein [Aquabacterium sp.]|jgi:PAS domain S-box-containing protein|uniref:ATP-binding protein n=1 Tax=Aquabacterium sp. TaxID=1872578 RepID=UPI002A3602DA|nr:ATP-binding protein [Aquabacterium sp.]MDX9843806.1 ATP-binding protein [Aquabacterium sp.]
MNERSLRLFLPLVMLAVMLVFGAASLAYALHQKQRDLTASERLNLLRDVAHLVRLSDGLPPGTSDLLAEEVAQVASRPQVQVVLLVTEAGEVLNASRAAWRGRTVREVWPTLDLGRLRQAARGRLPDWQMHADGQRMDAVQSFTLPSRDDEVRSLRRAVVYVAYDLSTLRAQAQHAEVMGRVPDMLGWLAMMGLMVWLLGRYVTRPLAQLDKVSRALRRGEWGTPVPRGGFMEIDHLAGGFDALRQELAATWQALPDLLFELDGEGRYLRVLSPKTEWLLLAPERLIGKTVREVMPPAAAEVVHQALRDADKLGAVWGRELALDVPAGAKWFEISVARKETPDGVRPSYILISRNVTPRKEAEERLKLLNEELEMRVAARTLELTTAKDEAERANHSKSDFLSRMSHELRTPLNAILGFGQLLEFSAREPLQIAHVRQILHGGKHLLALINEVLDLARVESGQMTVSLEQVALRPLLEECLTLVRPQAQARDIRLLDVACGDAWQVRADRTRLKQVFLNLLSNAIKYNQTAGVVSVGCVLEDEGICIRFSDTGAGLTPDQQARLFVPFERLDAGEHHHVEGTGIGLALSKRLMTLMGGQIGVESQVGEGSTFWVRLPRAQDGTGPGDAAGTVRQAALATSGGGVAVRTVLCIEDNPNNLQLIESVVGMLPGVRLLSAMAPGLGLEMARTHKPHLILLDINLPDMDGYAVMQCLREHPATRGIPVIAVSANAMPRDLERSRAAGFAAYVTKPIDVGQLLRKVDELALSPEPD